MPVPGAPLPTRLLLAGVVGLATILVVATGVIAGVRGNHDSGPAALGGIGRAAAPPPAPGVGLTPGRPIGSAPITAAVPAGWRIEASSTDELVLTGPDAVIDLVDRDADPALTEATLADDTVTDMQRRHPDTHICRAPTPAVLDNGPPGIALAVCYTTIPPNGIATATDALVVESLTAGATGAHRLQRESAIFADSDAGRAVVEIAPVTGSVRWR